MRGLSWLSRALAWLGRVLPDARTVVPGRNPRWYEDGEPGTRRQWMERAYDFEYAYKDLRRKVETE